MHQWALAVRDVTLHNTRPNAPLEGAIGGAALDEASTLTLVFVVHCCDQPVRWVNDEVQSEQNQIPCGLLLKPVGSVSPEEPDRIGSDWPAVTQPPLWPPQLQPARL